MEINKENSLNKMPAEVTPLTDKHDQQLSGAFSKMRLTPTNRGYRKQFGQNRHQNYNNKQNNAKEQRNQNRRRGSNSQSSSVNSSCNNSRRTSPIDDLLLPSNESKTNLSERESVELILHPKTDITSSSNVVTNPPPIISVVENHSSNRSNNPPRQVVHRSNHNNKKNHFKTPTGPFCFSLETKDFTAYMEITKSKEELYRPIMTIPMEADVNYVISTSIGLAANYQQLQRQSVMQFYEDKRTCELAQISKRNLNLIPCEPISSSVSPSESDQIDSEAMIIAS